MNILLLEYIDFKPYRKYRTLRFALSYSNIKIGLFGTLYLMWKYRVKRLTTFYFISLYDYYGSSYQKKTEIICLLLNSHSDFMKEQLNYYHWCKKAKRVLDSKRRFDELIQNISTVQTNFWSKLDTIISLRWRKLVILQTRSLKLTKYEKQHIFQISVFWKRYRTVSLLQYVWIILIQRFSCTASTNIEKCANRSKYTFVACNFKLFKLSHFSTNTI